MPENLFSQFKKAGAIRPSNMRRFGHAISNKIRSTKGSRPSGTGGAALTGAGYASSAATIAAGSGAPTASTGWGVAAGADLGVALVTVASGPATAAGLALISLGLAAKSAFSNREQAHERLNGYVWTYIDAKQPKALNEDAKKAAIYLVMQGQSQANILADKLKSRDEKWRAFVKKFDELTIPHLNLHQSFQGMTDAQKREVVIAVCETNDEAKDLLDKAVGSGGVAVEFMRRLIHAGNYVQSYRIFAKNMVGDNSALEDFGNDQHALKYRAELARFSDRIKHAAEAAQTAMNYIQTLPRTTGNPIFQQQ